MKGIIRKPCRGRDCIRDTANGKGMCNVCLNNGVPVATTQRHRMIVRAANAKVKP